MQNGIDLSQFYQGLDALFQKKDSNETMRYLERWLQEAEDVYKRQIKFCYAVCYAFAAGTGAGRTTDPKL